MRRPAGKERGGGRRGGWQLAPGEDTGMGSGGRCEAWKMGRLRTSGGHAV